MATAPAPFPTFPSVTPPPPFCFGAPPYAPYPFPYPNQPPPPSPSPSYHAAAYHNHHSLQLPPPYHPNPHWHQGMQQMQPPPPAPGNPWHPHHAAAQPPPPSSPPPRRPPPSSPPPLATSMAAVAPAWPFPSASVPAVQEGAAPSTSSSGCLPDSPGTTSAPAAALIVLCSGPGPERRPSSPSSAPVLAPSATQARRPKPPTIPSREVQAREEATISKNMPRAVLDLKRRLDEQQARDRNSFASLQGELANLMSMAAQLAVSLGKELTSAHGRKLEQSQHISVVPAAPAHVASQVLDEMPQRHSFYNLNRQSLYREDGTKDSYFTLPADYSKERDVPEPVFDVYHSDGCSNEFVHVFSRMPKQQSDEEEEQDSEQLLTCIIKATASEQSGAYLNYISGVPDYTLEQQQNDDEKTPANLQQLRPTVVSIFSLGTDQKPDTKLCVKYVKPQISNQQRNTQMTEAAIKEWDPGDPQTILDLPAVVKWSSLEGLTHAVIFPPKILLSMNVYAAKSIPNILVSLPLYIQWDPGDTKYHALFTTAAGATKLQCVDIYKPTMVQILAVQFRARKVPIFESVIMCSYAFGLGWTEVNIQQLRDPSFKVLVPHESREEWDLGDHSILSSTLNKDIAGRIFTLPYVPSARIQFGVPTCVPKQSCYCRVPSSNENHEVQFLWDPGILNQMVTRLEETVVANPVHSMQTLFKLFFFIEQPVGLKFWTQLCHSWCSTPVFLQELHVPMIKTNNCTSTSIGVASSEYTYIVDFLPDQWEFLHRQDVQKNCNAKNLLLSESYLRTWEMDIIFLTFLPP